MLLVAVARVENTAMRWSADRTRAIAPLVPAPPPALRSHDSTRPPYRPRATQPDAARAENGTCAESSRDERGRCGCRSAAARTWGGARKGAGRKPRGRPCDAARHATQDRPALSGAGHHPSDARAAVASLAARVRSAPTRHRAGVGRSLPGDPLLDPAGPRPLHRRGGRGAPRPRRRARAGDPIGARGQPRARAQGEGRRRPVSRPTADDAATDADEHGLRAAQLPEAPPRPRVHRPAELGAAFLGVAARPAATDVAPATALPRTWMARVGWRRAGGPLRVEEHPAAAPRPHPT